jgi:bacterioferritin-associated ferredoxin
VIPALRGEIAAVRLDLITVFIILIRERVRMYVCVCRAVTEDSVKAAIEGGARSVDAVTASCCAGDDCGACHQVIEQMIETHTGAPAKPSRHLRVVRAA